MVYLRFPKKSNFKVNRGQTMTSQYYYYYYQRVFLCAMQLKNLESTLFIYL